LGEFRRKLFRSAPGTVRMASEINPVPSRVHVIPLTLYRFLVERRAYALEGSHRVAVPWSVPLANQAIIRVTSSVEAGVLRGCHGVAREGPGEHS